MERRWKDLSYDELCNLCISIRRFGENAESDLDDLVQKVLLSISEECESRVEQIEKSLEASSIRQAEKESAIS